jgi:hypothetical protein
VGGNVLVEVARFDCVEVVEEPGIVCTVIRKARRGVSAGGCLDDGLDEMARQ